MKKTLLSFCALCLLAGTVMAHVLGAVFGWSGTLRDLGQIQQGKPVTVVYSFTNKGEAPLLITSAKGSCGCTGVEWPRQAILPGATGAINATFNAATMGAFNKSITVESNVEGGPVTLFFKGEVVEANQATAGR